MASASIMPAPGGMEGFVGECTRSVRCEAVRGAVMFGGCARAGGARRVDVASGCSPPLSEASLKDGERAALSGRSRARFTIGLVGRELMTRRRSSEVSDGVVNATAEVEDFLEGLERGSTVEGQLGLAGRFGGAVCNSSLSAGQLSLGSFLGRW